VIGFVTDSAVFGVVLKWFLNFVDKSLNIGDC